MRNHSLKEPPGRFRRRRSMIRTRPTTATRPIIRDTEESWATCENAFGLVRIAIISFAVNLEIVEHRRGASEITNGRLCSHCSTDD